VTPGRREVGLGSVVLSVIEHPGPAAGGGVPVVLLPGTGLTARSWDVVAASLATSRPVVAVDLRGHGSSEWPGVYSIAGMARDVADLLGVLGVLDVSGDGRVDLVGHSLGGLVALRVAAEHPDRVRRLVLEDVGMLHPREPGAPERPEGELDFDWRVVEQVRPEIDDPDPSWPSVVAAVAAGTLVVAGGPSSFVSAEHVAELVAALPDGRSVTLDTGHEVHSADPVGFVREVLAFLDA
jgi:pimeloyl-ACP methyl ester carboxylesterase